MMEDLSQDVQAWLESQQKPKQKLRLEFPDKNEPLPNLNPNNALEKGQALYESGCTLEQAAAQAGVTSGALFYFLKLKGKKRKKGDSVYVWINTGDAIKLSGLFLNSREEWQLRIKSVLDKALERL